MTKNKSMPRPSSRRKWLNRQRGQSLAELAIALPFLIITLSGVVDLGRAFFTRITLETAVSEGAHWMAGYPGCVYYGAAFGQGGNIINMPGHCQGTNSIIGRMTNESNLLLPANIVSTSLTPTKSGERIDQVVAGDVIDISITYKMQLLSPVMAAAFGGWINLTVDALETVRGTDIPASTGALTPYVQINTTLPRVTQIKQLKPSDPEPSGCFKNGSRPDNDGFPPLQFTEPSWAGYSQPTGYQVWVADAGLGNDNPSPTSKAMWIADIPYAGSPTPYQIDTDINHIDGTKQPPAINLQTGGSQLYGIRAYIATTSGSPPVTTYNYGDWEYFLATCSQVIPTFDGPAAQCIPAVAPATVDQVAFTWKMPTYEYAWQTTTQPVAWTVNHYDFYGLNTNTNVYTRVFSTPSGSGRTFTATFNLPAASDPVNGWERTASYYIVAVGGDNNQFGVDTDGNIAGTHPATAGPADTALGC